MQGNIAPTQEATQLLRWKMENRRPCPVMATHDDGEWVRYKDLPTNLPALLESHKRLAETLEKLMTVLTPELTGSPKNVPKSMWAQEWDEAAEALAKAKQIT